MILRDITEANARKIALESGEIDVAQNLTPDMFKAAGNKQLQTLQSDSLRLQYLAMNSGAGSVSGLLGGLGRKTQTIIPRGLFGASAALPYQRNVAKAKALLAAAGKPGDFAVELLVPSGVGGGVPYADLAAKLQADLAAAALSFIGFGAQPPTPEWGAIVSETRTFISTAPWASSAPAIAIVLTVLAFNLLGDSLRDALDPRSRR